MLNLNIHKQYPFPCVYFEGGGGYHKKICRCEDFSCLGKHQPFEIQDPHFQCCIKEDKTFNHHLLYFEILFTFLLNYCQANERYIFNTIMRNFPFSLWKLIGFLLERYLQWEQSLSCQSTPYISYSNLLLKMKSQNWICLSKNEFAHPWKL